MTKQDNIAEKEGRRRGKKSRPCLGQLLFNCLGGLKKAGRAISLLELYDTIVFCVCVLESREYELHEITHNI